METATKKILKYKIIKSREQYDEYGSILETIVLSNKNIVDVEIEAEIDLLTLLIEKWDEDHNSFSDLDPVQLLKALMREHDLKSKDLVAIMGVSKGMVSSILNYRKGLSKESIRRLSTYFKLKQEAFNQTYTLGVKN